MSTGNVGRKINPRKVVTPAYGSKEQDTNKESDKEFVELINAMFTKLDTLETEIFRISSKLTSLSSFINMQEKINSRLNEKNSELEEKLNSLREKVQELEKSNSKKKWFS